jgi:acetoin utilization deacetylase AcuC-like enzyme
VRGGVSVLYFHHGSSRDHDPRVFFPDHPDVPERIDAIEQALETAGWPGCSRAEAPPATVGELELVHAPMMIGYIRRLCLSGGGRVDEDTFVGEASYTAALHAAGGACAMVRELVAGGADAAFCGLRPSGHHALRDQAMGFCLFNNVAIAAEMAIRELGVKRVFILDWDVHHGNGTADFFRRRSDVLFASIHQGGIYPGSGAVSDAGSGEGLGYTINAPVPPGADEEVWLSVLEHVILPAAQQFRPELILISAGFDAHDADPLAGCCLESESYAQMTAHVMELAASIGAPVGAVLEGGYEPRALADSVLATVRAMDGQTRAESIAPHPVITSRVASHVSHFWGL